MTLSSPGPCVGSSNADVVSVIAWHSSPESQVLWRKRQLYVWVSVSRSLSISVSWLTHLQSGGHNPLPVSVCWSFGIVCIKQRSPVFLAPGMGFMEGNFSTDKPGWGVVQVVAWGMGSDGEQQMKFHLFASHSVAAVQQVQLWALGTPDAKHSACFLLH